MTELDLIIDFHKDAERQGPGSVKDTLRALDLIDLAKGEKLKIADIGCGIGGHTITLAQHTQGQIIAIDLLPDFLEVLDSKTEKLGLQNRISTLAKSMEELAFGEKELDIIWSEGAIYNMGFENGIQNWKQFLKIGGYLAVSEVTWTSMSRPKEIQEFWDQAYPEIDTASNKIRILEQNGYTPVGFFMLTQNTWMESYYRPMEGRLDAFLEKYNHSELAEKVVDEYKYEIDLFKRFKDYYSYGFYVVKRIE